MKYAVRGNGRCLENCAAVHTFEDENEGVKIRKKINEHVVENWDTYWKFNVGLPYRATLVVDGKVEEVEKKTKEEMMDFLKSDKAMKVYSTGHELLAIANMFNIRIHIFTFEGKEGKWNEVVADHEVTPAERDGLDYETDMFLYHSKNNHYDLLVKEDSRIALINPSVSKKEKVEKLSEEWKTVKSRKHNSNKNVSNEEELLKEDEPKENRDGEDVNGLEEELVLIKNNNSGHRRTDPQASAESVDNNLIF